MTRGKFVPFGMMTALKLSGLRAGMIPKVIKGVKYG